MGMKTYQVKEKLIKCNRSWKRLAPKGFVIHSTDNEGATAKNHFDFWNAPNRGSSVHYVADWIDIIRLVPENEVAWHAGPTANKMYLGVEMCEPKRGDAAKFQEVWNRTVELVADACIRYGWNTRDNVWSHNGISKRYPKQTDHTDPYAFLQRYGKTWADLLKAIDAKISELKSPAKSQEFMVHGTKAEEFGPYLLEAYAKNKCNQLKAAGYNDIHYIKPDGTKVPIK